MEASYAARQNMTYHIPAGVSKVRVADIGFLCRVRTVSCNHLFGDINVHVM